MTLNRCPVCGTGDPDPVFTLPQVPVICNQLWPDPESARKAARGDVELVICTSCALLWNRAFEPARMRYAPGYENALHFSPTFRAFAEGLAAELVERYDLVGGHAVEIGCGDGHMLDLLVRNGMASATGFDPSMAGKESEYANRPGVTIIPEYFRSSHLERSFDLLICRHVLEHLEAPMELALQISHAIRGSDVPIYFEVPNAEWMLDKTSIWDVIYEHVTYWSAPALKELLRRADLRTERVGPGFGGQFLRGEATQAEPGPENAESKAGAAVHASAHAFARVASSKLEACRERIAALGGTAVIWGAGSKGISFANALGQSVDRVAGIVDVNPRKHGRYVAGAALPILEPEALRAVRPELVFLSNARYRDEVMREVYALGVKPDFEIIAG